MTPIKEELQYRVQVDAENFATYSIGPKLNRESFPEITFNWGLAAAMQSFLSLKLAVIEEKYNDTCL